MAKENPEEMEAKREETNRKLREKRAARSLEEAKIKEEENNERQRDRNAKLLMEDPGAMEARREERNRNQRQKARGKKGRLQDPPKKAMKALNAKNYFNPPGNPELGKSRRKHRDKLKRESLLRKAAKEKAAVSERNNSFTSPTSDNRSVGPASPKDLEYYNTPSPDNNSAFTMTDVRTSLPPSNPGQPAHSRIDLPSAGDHCYPSSMNNFGLPAPPSTHIQTANSRSDPPSTSYYNSGPPTNNNNSLLLARGYGPARPEMPAGYESAGFGASFAKPISGHYYPSSMTSYESLVPRSTTLPTADSMHDYSTEELNRWWNDSVPQGYEEGNS
ncbi:hypothetical protein BHYA_0115g00020 [Botrytis hyacinthi]|uniref:Uncharacterized protein n=1 Tax=Botrytis hyacinthi TaxID=278943 RepID=A0A4Z1GT52_9HELO|nr:hypothetical protein BHYA_0115g00020 [Botrytis hyacinthi]